MRAYLPVLPHARHAVSVAWLTFLASKPEGVDFQYPALDREKQQIGTFRLQREDSAGCPLITRVIQIFDQETAPPDHALSHRCDSQQPNHSIHTNERTLVIELDLHKFLTEYRRYSFHREERARQRWLWIDEVCIDQRNTLERNH